MEDNKKLITTLMVTTLLLTLVTAIGVFSLYSKFGAISGTLPKNTEQTSDTQQNNQPDEIANVSAADAPTKGAQNAPVTIVEFSDFQCPFCAMFPQDAFLKIESDYIATGKVKFAFRNFPLPSHQFAQKAAEAAYCAFSQGKFWEYHDKLFANQEALATNNLKQYAKDLGLNSASFNSCLDSGAMTNKVKKDVEDATSYGVDGTPTFFINGQKVVGALPFASFQQVIEGELNK